MIIATPVPDLKDLKKRLREMWMAGDYDLFARYMEKGSEPFYERLGFPVGTRVLDVACGAGQMALIAARSGASVTGCDIATNWIERARTRAARERLNVAFEEGDAESLPYKDASFDAVISFVGAMFAPRPELVAAELARVCRPGGLIAMANWTPGGFVGKMFAAVAKHVAPSAMPSPLAWGHEETVRRRFAGMVSSLQLNRRIFVFEYPFQPQNVVDFFQATYGPMSRAFASLNLEGRAALQRVLTRLWFENNTATKGGTRVEAEYLEVVATRQT
jgi:SAM-dependent methyltransferase